MAPKNYLQKISDFYFDYGRLPSYSEIMELTGLRSKNSVYKLMQKLLDNNWVEKDEFGKYVPGPRMTGTVSVLGTVQAGFPSSAEEELADVLSLDDFLVEKKEATYVLEVSGDSMVDAGIMPGDLVLVERGREPKSGDIVVAEVDNEWTVKYFRRSGPKIYLEAANNKYPDFYPEEELKIEAVVRAVLRKY